tara:strand:+ start:1336 stop:1602 length:267 start_codon:yes stop_codon:yes gene_type:complete
MTSRLVILILDVGATYSFGGVDLHGIALEAESSDGRLSSTKRLSGIAHLVMWRRKQLWLWGELCCTAHLAAVIAQATICVSNTPNAVF